MAAIASCTRGGDCERKCPYGLPIVEMLQAQLGEMKQMIEIYRGLGN
jgi:CO dehydrogenase/acetyl-CoA synthase alpha subunit